MPFGMLTVGEMVRAIRWGQLTVGEMVRAIRWGQLTVGEMVRAAGEGMQGTGDKDADHLLAVWVREVRVVERLARLEREIGGRVDQLRREPVTDEQLRGFGLRPRLGGDGAQGDRGIT